MKAEVYPIGALVGGVVGGVLRGGFTYYNLMASSSQDDAVGFSLAFMALLPSAGIGVLCGAIAGLWGRPWLGALIGAALSAGLFVLFVLPFTFCFGLFGAEKELLAFSVPYFIQRALAGAIAGAVGGAVGPLSQKPPVTQHPDATANGAKDAEH